jgi:hypothetical protein
VVVQEMSSTCQFEGQKMLKMVEKLVFDMK